MPKRAVFPLDIETGFIVNAPVSSNTAALSIYSLCATQKINNIPLNNLKKFYTLIQS